MRFSHLWIRRNHRSIRDFLHRLEEKSRYTSGPLAGGFRALSVWNQDGQHDVTFTTPDEVENHSDRLRGRYFDKVSIEEGIELTWSMHNFLQLCAGRSNRALYGSLGPLGIEVDERVAHDKIRFLFEESVALMSRRLSSEIYASDPLASDYRGLISRLSV